MRLLYEQKRLTCFSFLFISMKKKGLELLMLTVPAYPIDEFPDYGSAYGDSESITQTNPIFLYMPAINVVLVIPRIYYQHFNTIKWVRGFYCGRAWGNLGGTIFRRLQIPTSGSSFHQHTEQCTTYSKIESESIRLVPHYVDEIL